MQSEVSLLQLHGGTWRCGEGLATRARAALVAVAVAQTLMLGPRLAPLADEVVVAWATMVALTLAAAATPQLPLALSLPTSAESTAAAQWRASARPIWEPLRP